MEKGWNVTQNRFYFKVVIQKQITAGNLNFHQIFV